MVTIEIVINSTRVIGISVNSHTNANYASGVNNETSVVFFKGNAVSCRYCIAFVSVMPLM